MRLDIKMMGYDGSGNVLAPNLTLKLDYILKDFPENRRKDELSQVTFLILRNIHQLRQLYNYYCSIGHNRVQSAKSELTRLQFWRFLLDSQIHHYHLSLPEMDRLLAISLQKKTAHQPLERLSLSDFLTSLAVLGYVLFKEKVTAPASTKSIKDSTGANAPTKSLKSSFVLSFCLQQLIKKHILRFSGQVKGGFLFESRNNVNALKYMEGSWRIFKSICNPHHAADPTVGMRDLLLALKEYQIVGPKLSAEKFLEILASDHPNVAKDGEYNLEFELTFLEYFEILLECAVTMVKKEDLEKQTVITALRPQKVRTGPTSAGRGIGHSRPGSAYSKRSLSSARSVLSISSTVMSIEENNDIESDSDKTVTLSKNEEEPSHLLLQVGANTVENLQPGTSVSPPIFFEIEEREDEQTKSSRSFPEVQTAEIQAKEKQFTLWASQLNIFFNRYLFTGWHRVETLRREAARHRNSKN